jgi:hypothetical protein
MFFPDARQLVEVPVFTPAQVEELKRKLYRPAFVEMEKRPELSFAFLRPPGWEVGPPAMPPSQDYPVPSLASVKRTNPTAAMEVGVVEAPYDCLPGDFLDCVLDGLTCTHASEGPVGDGWYADRSAHKDHGAELMAAHRRGGNLYVFLCAFKDATPKTRDEVLSILGTFSLKQEPASRLVGRWHLHGHPGAVPFAIPESATVAKAPGGVAVTWSVEGGTVELSARTPGPKERSAGEVQEALRTELKRKGILLEDRPAVRQVDAPPGSTLSGPVSVTTWQATPESKLPVEVTLLLGTRPDGSRLRVTAEVPARTAHKIAWMRGRFALVQAVTTLGMQPA